MIERIKPLSGVFHATAISGLSMVLGLVREIVCARIFGAGQAMDLFLYGFTLYDILLPATRDIPSGVQGCISGKNTQQFRLSIRLIIRTCVAFGAFAAVLELFFYGWIGAPALHNALTHFNWFVIVVSIAVAILLATLHAGLCAYYVHDGNVKFQLYQPVWLNVGIIVGALSLSSAVSTASIAIGVLLGTVLLLIHEIFTKRIEIYSIIFSNGIPKNSIAVSGLLITMAFVLAQAVGSKGSVLIERTVGISLAPGSLSLLNYAIRLWGIPISLFVIAGTLPMVPKVTRAQIDGNVDQIYRIFAVTMLTLLGAFLITTVVLWLFSDDIVRIIFQSGKFSAGDTTKVSRLLDILLFGSYGAAMSTVSARMLWIFGRSYEMALITWGAVGLYFLAAYPLVHSFGIIGLAIGNVFHYNLQAILSAILLRREFRKLGVTQLGHTRSRIT